MKKLLHSTIVFLLMNIALQANLYAQRACDRKESSDDICPIKINGVQVFDRCFGNFPGDNRNNAIGDAACDALRSANKMASQADKTIQAHLGDMKKDMLALAKVVSKDAINEEAVARFKAANNLMKQIDEEIKDILTDPRFGVNGRIKAIQSFFEQQGKNFVAVAGIAGSLGEAAQKVTPVIGEAAKIGAEISKIAASLSNASPEAKKQFDVIKSSVDAIVKNLQQLAATDVAGVVQSGTNLVTTVGPFVGNCVACAGVIGTGVSGISAGSTLTATTAACPESAGITCITGAAGVVTAAASGLVSSVAASVPCQEMLKQSSKMNEYINTISKFVNTVSELADDTQENLAKTEKAIEALNKLAAQLKDDNKQSLKNIALSLNKIADDFEAGLQVLETKTLPVVSKLGASLLHQLSSTAQDLVECYQKYSSVAMVVTKDALDAAGNLAAAAATLVDGKQIFENIMTQFEKAGSKAEDYIKSRKPALDRRANDLNKALFGVNIGVVDLGKTVATLTAIAGKSNPVKFLSDQAKEALDLAGDYIGLATAGFNEGKKAFLNLDRITIDCKKKTDAAFPLAVAAEKKLTSALANRKTKQPLIKLATTPAVLKIIPVSTAPKKITRATIIN